MIYTVFAARNQAKDLVYLIGIGAHRFDVAQSNEFRYTVEPFRDQGAGNARKRQSSG